jgi:aquaporin Z
MLKILWALPNTLLGIVIGCSGLLSGGGVLHHRGVLEFYGGLVSWFLRHLPIQASAMTLGHTILGQTVAHLDRSHDHEMVHVRQYERWGLFFLPAYLLMSALLWLRGRNAYMENPFEVEAYSKTDPHFDLTDYTSPDTVQRIPRMNHNLKKCLAETIGTFSLVFAGTGAIVFNEVSNQAITHVGISLVFGFIVMAMIYAIGDISGAHINPAVSLAFWLAGKAKLSTVMMFIGAQLLGAFAASLLLKSMFPENETLGATLPQTAVWHSFVLEVLLTFILMFVILRVSSGAKEKGIMAGAAIGGTVALEALFAGPICGASMNPARSIAPAVVSLHLEHGWMYLVAPLLGAALAVPCAKLVEIDDDFSTELK